MHFDPHTTKRCVSCGRLSFHPGDDLFSKAQLGKHVTTRRCNICLQAREPGPQTIQPMPWTEEQWQALLEYAPVELKPKPHKDGKGKSKDKGKGKSYQEGKGPRERSRSPHMQVRTCDGCGKPKFPLFCESCGGCH